MLMYLQRLVSVWVAQLEAARGLQKEREQEYLRASSERDELKKTTFIAMDDRSSSHEKRDVKGKP